LEPPLDTVVIDNKDKPNAEAPGSAAIGGLQEQLAGKLSEQDAMHQQKMRQQYEEEMSKVVF